MWTSGTRTTRRLAITKQKQQGKLEGEESDEDDDGQEKGGDELLEQLGRVRGLMRPKALWPATLIQFEALWSEYKRENGLLDFTDLIETCLRDVRVAPKNPSVIFADEAQDLNRMQLSLVRRWGRHAEYFIVAGDDDQTIYSFTGATPEAFLDPDIPDDHKIILKQSYPRAARRPPARREPDQDGDQAPGQRVSAARCGWRVPDRTRHVQARRLRHPQGRGEAPRGRARP